MKDRIKFILSSERLTTTRFAEMLGIQPSAVSHLVSGRNKPGYDLMQRVLLQFPRINPEWFMLGIGSPYRNQTSYMQQESESSPHETDLFNAPKIENYEQEVESIRNMGFSEVKAPESIIEPKQPSVSPTPPLPELKQIANSPQPVRVMIFYSDGTFESYSLRD
ncbi:MAG: helix-turn-helix transcriptional regulator [Rikenellaceae bacterium]